MSSLRRDLFERRLWPLVVLLVVGIVAVPLLLSGHHRRAQATLADVAGPVPAGGTPASSAGHAESASGHRARGTRYATVSSTRDPFDAPSSAGTDQGSGSSAVGGTQTVSSASSTTTPSTSTPSTTSTSSSSPATSSTTSASTAPAAGAATSQASTAAGSPSGSSSANAGTRTTSTPASASSGDGTTPATSFSDARSASSGQWTIEGVDARVQAPGQPWRTLDDLPRFSPLPAASWPRVMFMGVTTDGQDAVFALGAGVSARGAALCRPSHAVCELISLRVGQTERLSWPYRADQTRTMRLALSRITTRTLHDRAAASAAIQRHSAAGLCELELGDPTAFAYSSSGQLDPVRNATAACTKAIRRTAQPFPGSPDGDGASVEIAGASDAFQAPVDARSGATR